MHSIKFYGFMALQSWFFVQEHFVLSSFIGNLFCWLKKIINAIYKVEQQSQFHIWHVSAVKLL